MSSTRSAGAFAGLVLIMGALASPVVAGAGDVIAVPTDSTSTYTAIDLTQRPAGVVEVITERGGNKSHFYTIRDCDCPASKYRILGQGKTMEEARRRYPSDGSTELVKGSVSYDICAYACSAKPQK
jgi:hypothetical protein